MLSLRRSFFYQKCKFEEPFNCHVPPASSSLPPSLFPCFWRTTLPSLITVVTVWFLKEDKNVADDKWRRLQINQRLCNTDQFQFPCRWFENSFCFFKFELRSDKCCTNQQWFSCSDWILYWILFPSMCSCAHSPVLKFSHVLEMDILGHFIASQLHTFSASPKSAEYVHIYIYIYIYIYMSIYIYRYSFLEKVRLQKKHFL